MFYQVTGLNVFNQIPLMFKLFLSHTVVISFIYPPSPFWNYFFLYTFEDMEQLGQNMNRFYIPQVLF